MADVQKSVAVPSSSSGLADALCTLALAVIANHKAGGGAAVELSKDVVAAVGALSGPLTSLASLGDEVKAEPLGVAEAFALAGFQLARSLKGELPAA
jgi:hypothetical protein